MPHTTIATSSAPGAKPGDVVHVGNQLYEVLAVDDTLQRIYVALQTPFFQRAKKFLIASAGAVGGCAAFLADGEISQNDLIGMAVIVAGAFGTYAKANRTNEAQR